MQNLIRSLFPASDEQAMWRVKMQSDAQAFAQLVKRWEQPIRRLCERMTGDSHRAEDLTQETFARVFAKRRDWQPTGRFSTFLWRIAVNQCHDELRRIKRRSERPLEASDESGSYELETIPSPTASPDVAAEGKERGEFVRAAMMQLSPLYREVVVLRHYEGLKFSEIGEVLNIPEGTAKSRMAEALTQLERLLKPLNEDIICNRQNRIPELRAL
jgi:RNA polymerase sigma-70 factor (ECF subfamily)